MLLVTGLKARERTDYQGRIIQNSVAWVCENSDENEKQLRALAVRALRSFYREDLLLREEIDVAVKSSNKEGFKVDNFEDIQAQKLSKNVTVGTSNIPDLDNTKKIGNSDKHANELVKELANELEKYCLPKQKDTEPLIVVCTGIKAPSVLEQAGVWRGLSNLVQEEGWKDSEKNKTERKNSTLIALDIAVSNLRWYRLKATNLGKRALDVPHSLIKCFMFIILCLLLSQSQPEPNQETQLLPQPPSLSTQPALSPSPPSQLLENNFNATSIFLKIQDPSIESVKQTKISISQDRVTFNTSNPASQLEATTDTSYFSSFRLGNHSNFTPFDSSSQAHFLNKSLRTSP